MVLSLVACGDKKTDDNQDANNTDDQQGETTTYTNPDDIDDNMTSEDGKYEVAFVTDVGQLKDKSSTRHLRRRGSSMPPTTA